ncbi:uncharacterized protein LOC119884727 isoform X1 [Micropterus salmoides]|uniref:uncharacterized protein LOC119884727 isoform X1 n=1 Tax=Micropterus salmoides TaxID=27706 RepID=UPI0018EADA04|nr:uncharacterized protein LOC119884727 isoform X1 [Micropterus salmoides]
MDLLWMILPVFLLCAEAENLTEVKGQLGHSVTLNCSWNASDVYWYMEMHSQVRVPVARSFGKDAENSQYCFENTLKTKYQALENRLVITNITSEDHRLYICAVKIQGNISFKDAFRLVSADVPTVVPTVTLSTNSEANNHQQPASRTMWQNESVVYSSLALNVLLVSLVIGLVCTSLRWQKRNCNCQVNEPSPFTPETLETPQYEEIQLSTYRDPLPVSPPLECIYAKAQLPLSTLPRQ